MSLSAKELKEKYDYYWEQKGGTSVTLKIAESYYVEKAHNPYETDLDCQPCPSLLALEMEHAAQKKHLPVYETDKQITLVYLVGESYEPLLQSIWGHRPNKLIPVVNQYYGDRPPSNDSIKGQYFWEKMLTLIHKLPLEINKDLAIDPNPLDENSLIEDTPTAVFNYLHKKLAADLRDPNCKIIIDITGAKKTMVAGAFMFATYTKATIYYIDIERYKNGRPYGFSCHFRQVKSPLDQLSLTIWQQIARQYKENNFAGALQLLETVLEAPENGNPLRQLASVQHFYKFLKICTFWDSGQLDRAKEELDTLTEPALPCPLKAKIPTAVTALAHYWQPTQAEQFFKDQNAIVLHAKDELSRIDRLCQHQRLRSAFTRAYALNETLFKARVVALYAKQGKSVNKVVHDTLTRKLVEILLNSEAYNGLPKLQPFPQSLNPSSTGKRTLKKLRNQITHDYFPAHLEQTKQVIEWAKQNLQNYQEEWQDILLTRATPSNALINATYSLPSWETLRDLCDLHFIPETNVEEAA